jgi:hypothetical protein
MTVTCVDLVELMARQSARGTSRRLGVALPDLGPPSAHDRLDLITIRLRILGRGPAHEIREDGGHVLTDFGVDGKEIRDVETRSGR